MIVSTLEKWPRYLEERVEDAQLRCGSKQSERLNELNEVFQYSNAMLFFIPTFVLRAENEGVCCGSDLVAQDGSAQRIGF